MNNEIRETNDFKETNEIVYKDKKKGNKKIIIIVVVICFLFLASGAAGMYFYIVNNPDKFQKVITEVVQKKDVTITDTGLADAVEKLYDAVVVVKTYSSNKLASTGTGFVYKVENGKAYILTNSHVIENGTEIHVEFTNGNNRKVVVVGSDRYADIAVLEIDESEIISVAQIGSSTNLRVGDTVFTVGAPLDASAYSGTVTRGIISGKDRLVSVSLDNSSSSDWIMSVLQTDAAINSGNSGGPLANANGEVIGINSLKLITSGVEGMGFAIPIETAIEYATKILNGEKISRPYLGVTMNNLADAKYFMPELSSVEQDDGVYIKEVSANSPAAKGGLKNGDIIIKANNQTVSSVAFLKYILYQHNVGDSIEFVVIRNNKQINVTVNLNQASDM